MLAPEIKALRVVMGILRFPLSPLRFPPLSAHR
jgi:hypothetical protein